MQVIPASNQRAQIIGYIRHVSDEQTWRQYWGNSATEKELAGDIRVRLFWDGQHFGFCASVLRLCEMHVLGLKGNFQRIRSWPMPLNLDDIAAAHAFLDGAANESTAIKLLQIPLVEVVNPHHSGRSARPAIRSDRMLEVEKIRTKGIFERQWANIWISALPRPILEQSVPSSISALERAIRRDAFEFLAECGPSLARIPYYSDIDIRIYVGIESRSRCGTGILTYERSEDGSLLYRGLQRQGISWLLPKLRRATGKTLELH